MSFLSWATPATVIRPAPSTAARHIRSKIVDYDRVGIPTGCHGVCTCGWTSAGRDSADAVERDLHAHLVAMQAAA